MSFSELFQKGRFLPSFFILLFVVCLFSQAQADVPDMMINSDGTSEIHNMSQIWVSPIDSNVAMIVWRDFRLGYRRVALGASYDEGHTWVDSLLSQEGDYRHSDPIICGDRLGNFYPMAMHISPIYHSPTWSDFNLWKTTDNGASWSGPFYLVNDPDSIYIEDKELLAIDRTGGTHDGNMYLAWSRFPNPTRILFMRSTTGGVSWEDTVVVGSVDQSGLPAGYFACPVVDADGNVYVFWESWYEIGGEYYQCQKMVKSTDGGQNFTDPEIILETNWIDEAPGQIRIQNSVSMDADITNGPYRGNIYLAVPSGVDEEDNSPSDIIFTKSTDGGDSWSSPIRVNDDPEGPSVYQFHPWLAVNQKGVIIVFFYDQRNDPPLYENFDTYIAFSFDGGETFTTNYRVSDVSSDPDDALALKNSERLSIIYGEGCNTGAFHSAEPSISEAFLRCPNGGAVVYVGCSAKNYAQHHDLFYREIFVNKRERIGEAFGHFKMAYAPTSTIDRWQRWVQFGRNLQGDSALRILGIESVRDLHLSSPEGCEVLELGTDLTIRWNASGTDFNPDEKVKLEYSADSGQTWHPIPGAQALPYNGRFFIWENCPLSSGFNYRVRVSSLTDLTINDMSSRDFTVGELVILTVQTRPIEDININISSATIDDSDIVTNFNITVLEGATVNVSAPEVAGDSSEFVFVRWMDESGNTITATPDYTFIITQDKIIMAEYAGP